MPKAYWIAFYRSISDPAALAEYARLSGPAVRAAGGRFLARGEPARAFEAGVPLRSVVIEFDTVERAIAAYQSPDYQHALEVLEGAAERDVRILEGAD